MATFPPPLCLAGQTDRAEWPGRGVWDDYDEPYAAMGGSGYGEGEEEEGGEGGWPGRRYADRAWAEAVRRLAEGVTAVSSLVAQSLRE